MDPEKSNIIKINRFKKMTFSEMKKINKEKIENKEHIGEKVANKKLLVEILNLDIKDTLNEFIFREKTDKPFKNLAHLTHLEIEKTFYVAKDSFPVFFSKLHKFDELQRKGTLDKCTPTMAFIDDCKKEKIYPNPVGIIKREGEENVLNLK